MKSLMSDAFCRTTLVRPPLRHSKAHTLLGQTYEQEGRYLEAVTEFEKASTLEGDDGLNGSLPRAGHAYALAGKKSEALKILARLTEPSQPRRPFSLAIVYQGLRDKERALALLKEAVDAREQTDYLTGLGIEPIFDSLRSDPRFADLMRRVGLPQ